MLTKFGVLTRDHGGDHIAVNPAEAGPVFFKAIAVHQHGQRYRRRHEFIECRQHKTANNKPDNQPPDPPAKAIGEAGFG